jgi:hypothetical protein
MFSRLTFISYIPTDFYFIILESNDNWLRVFVYLVLFRVYHRPPSYRPFYPIPWDGHSRHKPNAWLSVIQMQMEHTYIHAMYLYETGNN